MGEVFNDFCEKSISVVNLMKVIEFIFFLPGSSARVERLFSLMNSVWSLDRSRMLERTIQVLLFCRPNIEVTCPEFNEQIENNHTFLQKVVSSENMV
jgi:hypothetical protein